MEREAMGTPTLTTTKRATEGTPHAAVQDCCCFDRTGPAHVCCASPTRCQTFGEAVNGYPTERTATAACEDAKREEHVAMPTLVVGCFYTFIRKQFLRARLCLLLLATAFMLYCFFLFVSQNTTTRHVYIPSQATQHSHRHMATAT